MNSEAFQKKINKQKRKKKFWNNAIQYLCNVPSMSHVKMISQNNQATMAKKIYRENLMAQQNFEYS